MAVRLIWGFLYAARGLFAEKDPQGGTFAGGNIEV
jgi:hypothetical protein